MQTKTYEKRQLVPEVYSETSQTSKMLLLAKIVNGFQPLAVLAKSLDVLLGSEYASEYNLCC